MTVQSSQGQRLGRIEEVVRSKDDNDLYAVVTTSSEKAAVRIRELRLNDVIYPAINPQQQLRQKRY